MRVALLSGNARSGDAIGNQIAEKVAFFRDRGAEVRIFLSDSSDLHPALGDVATTWKNPGPDCESWDYLATSDVIVVEFGQDYPLLDLVPSLSGGKPRVLFDYHCVTPAAFFQGQLRYSQDRAAQRRGLAWFADAVLAHSHFGVNELVQATGLPTSRCRVIGHPLDPARILSALPGRQMSVQSTTLLFVGRLAPNKRVPVLVEALACLLDIVPPVHALIVGDTSDVYEEEARRCRKLAELRGVGDRLHFTGRQTEQELRATYERADVFVMPSRHEGFCIPVLEAMACGVPVVAARAGALPETLGGAGLTFEPDDAADLADKVRRVLRASAPHPATRPSTPRRWRVVLVAHRFGEGIVGGAETSLRTIALALAGAKHEVEVFTTCNRQESPWKNELPEGTTWDHGIPVHRFPIDPHHHDRHCESFRAILDAEGEMAPALEQDYLENSLHSAKLIAALRQRVDELDAIVVGPYLFGLTHDVAAEFRDKVLLVPCFHDEPLARLALWRRIYAGVGGLLYHSPEEKCFAEVALGLSHPGGHTVGTWLESTTEGDAARGRRRAGTEQRYVVYAGRYSTQKNLPLLLDFARRYRALHPYRFAFVFMGQGDVAIPRESGLLDLGCVNEECKCDLIAGAAALVQLSVHESLSLVALEAWSQHVPVLAHKNCAALRGLIERSGAGAVSASFEEFAGQLDDMWLHAEKWAEKGRRGTEFVHAEYGCRTAFVHRLESALADKNRPLVEQLRQRGLEQATRFERGAWRVQFARLLEDVLHQQPLPSKLDVVLAARTASRTVAIGQEMVQLPVRVRNEGTHPLLLDGPARTMLQTQILNGAGGPCSAPKRTSLPEMILPRQERTVAVAVTVPQNSGTFTVQVATDPPYAETQFDLIVEQEARVERGCSAPILDAVRASLDQAEQRQRLPDDYLDVSLGFFARGKRWIKRTLLNNFKRAYVDVVSRQQSSFNRHVLVALHELTECTALLDSSRAPSDAGEVAKLSERLRLLGEAAVASDRRLERLDRRLARLERLLAYGAHAPARKEGPA